MVKIAKDRLVIADRLIFGKLIDAEGEMEVTMLDYKRAWINRDEAAGIAEHLQALFDL